jgi:hypothetical protein
MFRAIGILTSAAVLAIAVAGTTMAAGSRGGGSACQSWSVEQTSTGGAFASKSACLTYVRLGGQVFKPSFYFAPSTVGINTDAWFHVTGFHANSTGTLHEQVLGGSWSTFSMLGVPTNSLGNMAVISTVFTSQACSSGVYGAYWTFTDVYGVHASAYVWVNCVS